MQLNQSICWSCKILSFSNIVADEKKERKEVCQFALLILHVENESSLINGNQYFFQDFYLSILFQGHTNFTL